MELSDQARFGVVPLSSPRSPRLENTSAQMSEASARTQRQCVPPTRAGGLRARVGYADTRTHYCACTMHWITSVILEP